MTFRRYILATEPPKKFSHICNCPPNFDGKRSAPVGDKIISSVPRIRSAADGKIWGYIYVFMCSQDSKSDADLSWQHMQTGSRNPPKPKVVMTVRREDISTWPQRLWHSFRARPIHFHLRRHDYGEHHQVQTGSGNSTQTGSTNNLITETDIDAISMAILYFGVQVFHWCICQHHPTLPSPRNSKMADGYRK